MWCDRRGMAVPRDKGLRVAYVLQRILFDVVTSPACYTVYSRYYRRRPPAYCYCYYPRLLLLYYSTTTTCDYYHPRLQLATAIDYYLLYSTLSLSLSLSTDGGDGDDQHSIQ